MESYADAPTSIGEMRSDKTQRASDWSPREALISLLREIDKGDVDVAAMIVTYRVRVDEGTHTRFLVAGTRDIADGLGLLTRAGYLMNRDT